MCEEASQNPELLDGFRDMRGMRPLSSLPDSARLDWPVNPGDPPLCACPTLGLQTCSATLCFSHGRQNLTAAVPIKVPL